MDRQTDKHTNNIKGVLTVVGQFEAFPLVFTSRLEVITRLSAVEASAQRLTSLCISLHLIQTCFTNATSDSHQREMSECRSVSPFLCGSTGTRTPGPQAPGRAFPSPTVVLSAGSQDAETSGMLSVLGPSLPFVPQFDSSIQTFILTSLSLLLNAICLKRL